MLSVIYPLKVFRNNDNNNDVEKNVNWGLRFILWYGKIR